MRLLIIDNYDSFTYNLVQLVERAGCTDFFLVKNDALHQISPAVFDKVLVSPGPGIAREAGSLMAFLSAIHADKPVLGVCLGYEALAELFGGKLVQLPQPMHGIRNMGTVIRQDRIFNGLPDRFFIGHYHSWIIEEAGMPAALEILMVDQGGLPMAFRHREFDLTGLQFHPESIMTEHGDVIIGNWLKEPGC